MFLVPLVCLSDTSGNFLTAFNVRWDHLLQATLQQDKQLTFSFIAKTFLNTFRCVCTRRGSAAGRVSKGIQTDPDASGSTRRMKLPVQPPNTHQLQVVRSI